MTCQHCQRPIHKAMFGHKHDHDRMYGCYLGLKYLGTQASPEGSQDDACRDVEVASEG